MTQVQFTPEWSQYFTAWLLSARAAGIEGAGENADWYLFESDSAKQALKQRVLSYRCLPAQSAFSRAFSELKTEGLRPVRQPASAEPELTVEAYQNMPASEVVRRYSDKSHPEFRRAVDAMIAQGLI